MLLGEAKQRAQQRKAERQKLAAALQELQFQESCEPLRTQQSQRLRADIVQQQEQQVSHGSCMEQRIDYAGPN